MKPAYLFLMRHPETQFNAEGRYQGKQDVPLNQRGRWQLRKSLEALLAFPFQVIFTSPLARCLEVAKALVQKRPVPLYLDERLKELNYGVFEGWTREELEVRYPYLLRQWYRDPRKMAFPEGESFSQFWKRVRAVLEDIRKQRQSILLISHGGPLRILLCELLSLPPRHIRSFQFDNASLTCVASPFSAPRLLFQNCIFYGKVEKSLSKKVKEVS